jgi:hypothetical protein
LLLLQVIAAGVDEAEMARRAQHMRQQREALIAKKKADRGEKVLLLVLIYSLSPSCCLTLQYVAQTSSFYPHVDLLLLTHTYFSNVIIIILNDPNRCKWRRSATRSGWRPTRRCSQSP